MPFLPTSTAVAGKFQTQSVPGSSPGTDALQIVNSQGQVAFRVRGDGSTVTGIQPSLQFSSAASFTASLGSSCWQATGTGQTATLQTPTGTIYAQLYLDNNGVGPLSVVASSGTINGSASPFSIPQGQAYVFSWSPSTTNWVAGQDL